MRGFTKSKPVSGEAPAAPTSAASEAYEVRCHHCDVSFPVGTKRCLHCGERVGVPAIFLRQLTGDSTSDFGQPEEFSTMERSPVHPIDFPGEEDAEPRGASVARVLGNLSWIILFIAITVYRSCTG